jgi:hypothetical protein
MLGDFFILDHFERQNENGVLTCYYVHIFVQHNVVFLQLVHHLTDDK